MTETENEILEYLKSIYLQMRLGVVVMVSIMSLLGFLLWMIDLLKG